LGGVPRADESGYQSLLGLEREFTSTFEWRPELSSREWSTDISIASWTDDVNHIDLYYDKSAGKFMASDGVHTVMTGSTYKWEHLDSIKFGLSNREGGFMLSVETPLNGSEHVVSGGSLLGEPNLVVFGTDYSGTGIACGLIATVRHWSRMLDPNEIGQVWDVYEPLGDINKDWFLDFGDFAIFSKKWLDSSCQEYEWCSGSDFDESGVVDEFDLDVLNSNWLSGL